MERLGATPLVPDGIVAAAFRERRKLLLVTLNLAVEFPARHVGA